MGKSADKGHVGTFFGQRLISFEQRFVVDSRNWIEGFTVRLRIFADHGRPRMLLPGQMFELGDAGVRVIIRKIYGGNVLNSADIGKMLVLERQ